MRLTIKGGLQSRAANNRVNTVDTNLMLPDSKFGKLQIKVKDGLTKEWKLKMINYKKTEFMLLSEQKSKNKFHVRMGNNLICRKNDIKYLGHPN